MLPTRAPGDAAVPLQGKGEGLSLDLCGLRFGVMDQLALCIWDLLEGAEPECGYTLDALTTATGASYTDVRAALLQLQDIDAARCHDLGVYYAGSQRRR